MGAQKSLCLMNGLESPHASLSDPRWLMREFRPIISVLEGTPTKAFHKKFTVDDLSFLAK